MRLFDLICYILAVLCFALAAAAAHRSTRVANSPQAVPPVALMLIALGLVATAIVPLVHVARSFG